MKTKVKLESSKVDIETHRNQFNNSDQDAKIYKNQSISALLDFLWTLSNGVLYSNHPKLKLKATNPKEQVNMFSLSHSLLCWMSNFPK